jgi:hypothetical protein
MPIFQLRFCEPPELSPQKEKAHGNQAQGPFRDVEGNITADGRTSDWARRQSLNPGGPDGEETPR